MMNRKPSVFASLNSPRLLTSSLEATTTPTQTIPTSRMAATMKATNRAIKTVITTINTMIKEPVASNSLLKDKDAEEAMIRRKTRRRSATSP